MYKIFKLRDKAGNEWFQVKKKHFFFLWIWEVLYQKVGWRLIAKPVRFITEYCAQSYIDAEIKENNERKIEVVSSTEYPKVEKLQ